VRAVADRAHRVRVEHVAISDGVLPDPAADLDDRPPLILEGDLMLLT